MLPRTERAVHLVRLGIGSYPKSAPVCSLKQVVQIIQQAHESKRAVGYITETGKIVRESAILGEGLDHAPLDPRNAIYLGDVDIDPTAGVATLLITRGNPDLADTALVRPSQNKVRYVRPEKDESQGCSAHVLISLNEHLAGNGIRLVIERVPLATKTQIYNFLNWLIRTAAENDPTYTYEIVKKGKKIQRQYRPMLRLADIPSTSLRRDMRQGRVSSIELIKETALDAGIDQSNVIKLSQEKILLKLERSAPIKKVSALLDKIFKKEIYSEYTEVVVNVSDLPGDKSKVVRFREEIEQAMDLLYTRTENIEFEVGVEQCHASINKTIKNGLTNIITDNIHWE